jgi:hypothetical protein
MGKHVDEDLKLTNEAVLVSLRQVIVTNARDNLIRIHGAKVADPLVEEINVCAKVLCDVLQDLMEDRMRKMVDPFEGAI